VDPLRVGLVENHEVIVLGLRQMLVATGDARLVAHARSVEEFVASGPDVDVVLLDLRLAGRGDLDRDVTALSATGARVLAYTEHDADPPDLPTEPSSRTGLSGVVRMCDPVAVLVSTMRRAVRAAGRPPGSAAARAAPGPVATLTSRELQVLAVYASGEKADRVARQLGITRETVLDHIRRIRVKYRDRGRPAPTKVDLYRRAVEDGLLPRP
jgi:DNA-binding NarL/FixJ family response regulator